MTPLNPNQDLIDRLMATMAAAEYSKNIEGMCLVARTIAELRQPPQAPASWSYGQIGQSYSYTNGMDGATDWSAASPRAILEHIKEVTAHLAKPYTEMQKQLAEGASAAVNFGQSFKGAHGGLDG